MVDVGPGGQPTPPLKCRKHLHKGEVMFVSLCDSSLKLLKFCRTLESQLSIRSYSRIHIGGHLSGMFLIKKNDLRKEILC